MYADNITPRARDWAIPLLVGVVAYVWAQIIVSDAVRMFISAIGLVFCGWAFVNFLHHAGKIIVSLVNDGKELDYQLSENHRIATIAKMNDAQLKAVRAGMHVVGLYPHSSGVPIYKLADEEVYLYTAWYILINSTQWNVHPINMFKPGTFHFDPYGDHEVDDYQQARNFHTWLVRYGYAYWGRGNTSASWKKGFTPDEVLKRLGMDRDTYKDLGSD